MNPAGNPIHRTISIAGQVRFSGDLMALIRLDESTLNTSSMNQANTRLLFGTLKVDAKKEAELIEARLDALKGNLFGVYKNSGEDKAPSDTVTDKKVRADPQVLALAVEHVEAVAVYSLCCEICAALDDRRAMVINLSANARNEDPGAVPTAPPGAARTTRALIDEARAAREAKEQERSSTPAETPKTHKERYEAPQARTTNEANGTAMDSSVAGSTEEPLTLLPEGEPRQETPAPPTRRVPARKTPAST